MLKVLQQAYITKDVIAAARSYEFKREAERLLQYEEPDSITALFGLARKSFRCPSQRQLERFKGM